MKYNIGQIVYHNLTNQKFLIIAYRVGRMYECRAEDYSRHTFEEEELRPENI